MTPLVRNIPGNISNLLFQHPTSQHFQLAASQWALTNVYFGVIAVLILPTSAFFIYVRKILEKKSVLQKWQKCSWLLNAILILFPSNQNWNLIHFPHFWCSCLKIWIFLTSKMLRYQTKLPSLLAAPENSATKHAIHAKLHRKV